MAEQTVELAPGESRVVSFEATPHEARVYHVSVDGLAGSFKAIAPPFDPWSYDFNGNGIIDTSEMLAAANDYYAGIITKAQVDQVVALWEATKPPPPPVFNPWSYDFNGNGYIDTQEALAAANDYFAGKITEGQMDQVYYLWQNNIYRWA